MFRIPADNDKIFACVRPLTNCPKCKNTVIAIMNMSAEPQVVTLDLAGYEGKYKCCCGKKVELATAQTVELKPWSWKIFTK